MLDWPTFLELSDDQVWVSTTKQEWDGPDMHEEKLPDDAWAASWLDGVAAGRYSMSQRKMSSIEAKGGSLERVAQLARERGVHLVRLTDDRGIELIAASLHPFEIVC